jgi:hypothetical protein
MYNEMEVILTRFKNAARRYCDFVDALSTHSAESFLIGVEPHLLELYASALQIPVVEPTTNNAEDDIPLDKNAWAALYKKLRDKIGEFDFYLTIFNSTEREAPVEGSLADDISEIYTDLKKSLEQIGEGFPGTDVLWDLRFSFRQHWGRHAISALKAIYDRHLI